MVDLGYCTVSSTLWTIFNISHTNMLPQNISILNWKIFNFNPLVAGFKRCWIPFPPWTTPTWTQMEKFHYIPLLNQAFATALLRNEGIKGWFPKPIVLRLVIPKNPWMTHGKAWMNGGLTSGAWFWALEWNPETPKHREDWKCWMGAQGIFTSLIVGISVMRRWQTEIG